jgi:hypothetical protein
MNYFKSKGYNTIFKYKDLIKQWSIIIFYFSKFL